MRPDTAADDRPPVSHSHSEPVGAPACAPGRAYEAASAARRTAAVPLACGPDGRSGRCAPGVVIGAVAALVAEPAARNGVSVTWSCEPAVPEWIDVDAIVLLKLLRNLALHAVDARISGDVCVRARATLAHEGEIEFYVGDSCAAAPRPTMASGESPGPAWEPPLWYREARPAENRRLLDRLGGRMRCVETSCGMGVCVQLGAGAASSADDPRDA